MKLFICVITFYLIPLESQANWQHGQGNGHSAFEDGINLNDPHGLMPGSGKGKGRGRTSKLTQKNKPRHVDESDIPLQQRKVVITPDQKKSLDDYWAKRDAGKEKNQDYARYRRSLSSEQLIALEQAKKDCHQFMGNEVTQFVKGEISFRELRFRYLDFIKQYSGKLVPAIQAETSLGKYMVDMSAAFQSALLPRDSHYPETLFTPKDPAPIKRGDMPGLDEINRAFVKAFGKEALLSEEFNMIPIEKIQERDSEE